MWCLIYLCCLCVAGYPVAAGLAREATKLEIAGLSVCMGPGIMGMCLIFLSMAGFRPVPREILAITSVLAVAGIIIRISRKPSAAIELRPGRTPPWWAVACFVAMGYALFSVALDALYFPMIEWDAFSMWQLKAEVLTILPLNPRPAYFTDLSVSYSHLRYPLLVPMVSAGLHAMTGTLDDLGKTISLVLFPGMIAVVYAAVRRLNGTTAALTAAALLACSTPMMRYGGSGTAETALTAFYACSVLCIVRWQETRRWGYLILTALFSAWMTWTKNEGLALAAVNAVVIAAMGPKEFRRKSFIAAAALVATVGVLYVPWIVFSWGLPQTDEDYAHKLNPVEIFSNLGKLKTVVGMMALEILNFWDWGLFWALAIILSITERHRFRNRVLATVGLLVVLQLLIYIPPPMVAPNWKVQELLTATMDRLLMHAAPAAAILIGALWPGWAGGTNNDSKDRA